MKNSKSPGLSQACFTISYVSWAIINSSLVGIKYTFIFESSDDISTASPFDLFLASSIFTPRALNPSITGITLNWRYRDTYTTTTIVPITVQDPTVELLINHQPNCVDYNEGEFFDPTGMEV